MHLNKIHLVLSNLESNINPSPKALTVVTLLCYFQKSMRFIILPSYLNISIGKKISDLGIVSFYRRRVKKAEVRVFYVNILHYFIHGFKTSLLFHSFFVSAMQLQNSGEDLQI